jgi:hypothetical protein
VKSSSRSTGSASKSGSARSTSRSKSGKR